MHLRKPYAFERCIFIFYKSAVPMVCICVTDKFLTAFLASDSETKNILCPYSVPIL